MEVKIMDKKTISTILPIKKYQLLKILVKIKDSNINKYINDLITRDLKDNIDMIKRYQSLLEQKK